MLLCRLPHGTRGRRLCRLDRITEDKEVDHAAAVAARGDMGLASCLGALPYATNMCRATMVLTLLPRYEHEEPLDGNAQGIWTLFDSPRLREIWAPQKVTLMRGKHVLPENVAPLSATTACAVLVRLTCRTVSRVSTSSFEQHELGDGGADPAAQV